MLLYNTTKWTILKRYYRIEQGSKFGILIFSGYLFCQRFPKKHNMEELNFRVVLFDLFVCFWIKFQLTNTAYWILYSWKLSIKSRRWDFGTGKSGKAIAAWPVDSFIEANDFTGKTVIPFCTSSSSGLGQSGELLAEMAGTGNWQEGHRFSSSVSEADVQEWLDGLNLG